jgi:hypothetical protein
MKIKQIKLVDCPVWVDNVMTTDTEPRVLVVFTEVKSINGLASGSGRTGSLFLHKQITLAEAEAALPLDEDFTGRIAFEAKPDSPYFKAVIL